MSLLVLQLNDLEAVVAVFELMFVGALLDVVFEKLRNFYILGTELTTCYVLTLFGQMKVIKVFVLEFVAIDATKLTIPISLLVTLVCLFLYLAYLGIHVLFHSHQYHRIEFLEIFHYGLLSKQRSKIRSYIVRPILFSQRDLLLQQNIN